MVIMTVPEEWRMISLLEDMANAGLRCTIQSPHYHFNYVLEDLERLLVVECGTLTIHCLMKNSYLLDLIADYIDKRYGQ